MRFLFFLSLSLWAHAVEVSVSDGTLLIVSSNDIEIKSCHSSELNMDDLLFELNSGTNVVIRTLDRGRISILDPLIWNSSGHLELQSEESIVIQAIVGSLQMGNVQLKAAQDIVLNSSLFSAAQIFSQGGQIRIEAASLYLKSSGTSTEILAMNGDLKVELSGDLHLKSGMDGFPDAFSRLIAQNVFMNIGGDGCLSAGDGSRTTAEIIAQDVLDISFLGNLSLIGGFHSDRSFALIAGCNSTSIFVGGNALLTSGTEGIARIASRNGDLHLRVGKEDEGTLMLTGNSVAGPASIDAKGTVEISSNPNIEMNLGQIISKTGPER